MLCERTSPLSRVVSGNNDHCIFDSGTAVRLLPPTMMISSDHCLSGIFTTFEGMAVTSARCIQPGVIPTSHPFCHTSSPRSSSLEILEHIYLCYMTRTAIAQHCSPLPYDDGYTCLCTATSTLSNTFARKSEACIQ